MTADAHKRMQKSWLWSNTIHAVIFPVGPLRESSRLIGYLLAPERAAN